MTLELSKVTAQIDDMGRTMAARSRRQQAVLPEVRELLDCFSERQEELCQVADSESGRKLRCASPSGEPLNRFCPAPALPEKATLVGVDGSQIYPDSHGLAFYYAINVGSIVFRLGSGLAPFVATDPRIYYADNDLFPEGRPASGDLVSAQRDVAEMQVLVGLALAEPSDGPPTLALADGSLLMWVQRAAVPEDQQAHFLKEYLACFDQARAGGALLCGYVSRPRSAEVVSLLYLSQLRPVERGQLASLVETRFRGLTDRALFDVLEPGQRSALFSRGTADNRDHFQPKGHRVWFFYLNTGTDIARVEVPEWVLDQPKSLNLVHAAVYEQCGVNNGYPYILTRADEQAVILGAEREALEAMVIRAMSRHGLPLPECSPKAQQKQVARWRRHR